MFTRIRSIANVPKGEYTLEAYHPQYGVISRKVAAGDRKVVFEFPQAGR